jgi:glucuronosyltransferase
VWNSHCFDFRLNDTYDLVFLEAIIFQSYHGLIHHVGSPPVIGIMSLECLWTAGDAMGTPTNPAFIPEVVLSYGNHMTFYERLQNTLFWLWIRSENLLIYPYLYYSYNSKD